MQLDALKAYPNVLVLTTSNITGAIDLAFVDRADIKAYVGPPALQVGNPNMIAGQMNPWHNLPLLFCSSRLPATYMMLCLHTECLLQARYEILRSCLAELQRAGILARASPSPLLYIRATCMVRQQLMSAEMPHLNQVIQPPLQ